MRSILEMTFAGEDMRVITVDGGAAALERALELRPDIVLADLSMEMDGYEVARAIKSELAGTAVVVLASQHTPYDEAKGHEAGVDDHIVKPFDTQNVIDRISRLAAAPRAAAAPGAHPYRDAGARPAAASVGAPARPAAPVASSAPPGTVSAPRPGVPRTTVAFGSAPIAAPTPPPAPAAPRPPVPPAAVAAPVAPVRPVASVAAAAPVAAVRPAPAATAPAAAIDAATSAMSEKLGGLGLSPQQADAVLALSREVIERVVWEIVPDLAETIIREELKRLTAG